MFSTLILKKLKYVSNYLICITCTFHALSLVLPSNLTSVT